MIPDVPEIEPTVLKARLDRGDAPVLIDVREAFERTIADLPEVGQLHVPMAALPHRLHELERDCEIVIYCRSGSRSASVVEFMLAQGFGAVFNLRGGILAWQEQVDPSLRRY